MAGRIRTLKPEWLEDRPLASSMDAVRVLSAGLILMSDDHGRGRADLEFIASQVWAYDRSMERIRVVAVSVKRLVDIRYVNLYEVNEQAYFVIRNWNKHQRVDHPGKSRAPDPPREILGDSRESLDMSREILAKMLQGIEIEEENVTLAKSSASLARVSRLISDLRPPISDQRSPTSTEEQEGESEGEPTRPAAGDSPAAPATSRKRSRKKPKDDAEPTPPGYAETVAVYFAEFQAYRGEKPPFGDMDGRWVKLLLKTLGGDAGRACQVIRNCYANSFFSATATIKTIALDPGKFVGGGRAAVQPAGGKWAPKPIDEPDDPADAPKGALPL